MSDRDYQKTGEKADFLYIFTMLLFSMILQVFEEGFYAKKDEECENGP